MHSTFKAALAVTAAVGALSTNAAWAASVSYTTPNVVTTAGSTQLTLGGQTFVNQGLQGMARIPAVTRMFWQPWRSCLSLAGRLPTSGPTMARNLSRLRFKNGWLRSA